MLAGHAIFTVENPRTGGRFTYRIMRAPDNDERRSRRLWFVSVLVGPDNVANYAYAGMLPEVGGEAGRFTMTRGSKIVGDAPSVIAFRWVWDRLRDGRSVEPAVLWHEGRCGCCGRRLTVPESIASGLGPVCAGRAA